MREQYINADGEYVAAKPIYFWWKLGLFLAVFLLLTLGLYIYFNFVRRIPLRISSETTYITAPLNARGQVDYQRYLNEKYNTPRIANDDNLLPLIWQITGVNQEDLEYSQDLLGYLDSTIVFSSVPQPRRWQSLTEAVEEVLEKAELDSFGEEYHELEEKLYRQIELVCAGLVPVDQLEWINNVQNDPAIWQEFPLLLERDQLQIPYSSQDNDLWAVSTAIDTVLGYNMEIFASLAVECWRLQKQGKHAEAYQLLQAGLHLADLLAKVPDSYIQDYAASGVTTYLYPAIAGLVLSGNFYTEQQIEELAASSRRIQLLSLEEQLELERIYLLTLIASWEYSYFDFAQPYSGETNLLTAVGILPHNPNTRNQVCNLFSDEIEKAVKTLPAADLVEQCEAIYDKYTVAYYDATNSTHLRLILAGQESRGKFWGEYFLGEYAWSGSYSQIRSDLYKLQTSQQMLEVILACKRFWIRQGHFPEQLDDLVPEYLTEIPLDSIRQQPFDYDVEDHKIRLKSWGWNGENDGEKDDDIVLGNWLHSLTPDDWEVPSPAEPEKEESETSAEDS